ncbi:MAG: WecB/TagA/CpsF family glycosyltransferase [Ignavibacteria bacterium]|nr:WecB/TagA/CpsF family glycosyltransferase [Ignavibacteria bacterium]
MHSFYFKNIKISCCNINTAADEVFSHLKNNRPDYICVTDVGNAVNAFRVNPELKIAINNSFLSLPDGRPLSLLARLSGISDIERVAGPDFMEEIFRLSSGKGYSHFLLGDTDEVQLKIIRKASEKYDIIFSGRYSPLFGDWDEDTDKQIIERINAANPDFIWVSLGGGRQEIWMYNNYLKLNKGIMTGVGAAFRFYTGEIKRAPLHFQKTGFEWLFRLFQQPAKMFRRYASTFPYFIYYSAKELFFKKTKL